MKKILIILSIGLVSSVFASSVNDIQTLDAAQRQKLQSVLGDFVQGLVDASLDSTVVRITGDQDVAGVKNFTDQITGNNFNLGVGNSTFSQADGLWENVNGGLNIENQRLYNGAGTWSLDWRNGIVSGSTLSTNGCLIFYPLSTLGAILAGTNVAPVANTVLTTKGSNIGLIRAYKDSVGSATFSIIMSSGDAQMNFLGGGYISYAGVVGSADLRTSGSGLTFDTSSSAGKYYNFLGSSSTSPDLLITNGNVYATNNVIYTKNHVNSGVTTNSGTLYVAGASRLVGTTTIANGGGTDVNLNGRTVIGVTGSYINDSGLTSFTINSTNIGPGTSYTTNVTFSSLAVGSPVIPSVGIYIDGLAYFAYCTNAGSCLVQVRNMNPVVSVTTSNQTVYLRSFNPG